MAQITMQSQTIGKIWRYIIATDTLELMALHILRPMPVTFNQPQRRRIGEVNVAGDQLAKGSFWEP